MATTPAMGNGPFEFTNSQGQHISIPLTAINFDATGTAVVDPPWNTLTSTPPGSALLALAVTEKTIQPRPTPSPFPAMIIRAADPGAGGNNIKVTVAVSTAVASPPTNDPTLTPFSITVTETDNYTGLTTATIESVLGSATVTGSKPGLVQIVHGSVDTNGAPLSHTGSLSGTPAELDVPGDGTPPLAFTLAAKKSGADGNLTQVTVTPDVSSPPAPGAGAFSLQATWTKAVNNITLAQLDTMVQSNLGYEIKVSKPSSGAYSVPANGDTVLSGGGGTAASGTLFTAQ
jgi:hypothetical protein